MTNCIGAGQVFCDTSFEINTSKRYIKSLKNYKDTSSRRNVEIKKDDRFQIVLVKVGSAKKNGHGILYVGKVTEVL